MKKILLSLLLATVGVHVSASTVFADRASWSAAAATATNVDFEGFIADNSAMYVTNGSTFGGVSFTSAGNGGLYLAGGAYGGGVISSGTGATLFDNTRYGTTLALAFPSEFNAFAVDLRGAYGSPTDFTLTFSNDEVYTLSSAASAGFFGATFDAPVTGVSIAFSQWSSLDNVSLANVSAADTAAVPEPGSAALLGIALIGLAVSRRKPAGRNRA